MSDFKAKMHQNRFRLGLHPRRRWGYLQRSPRPLARFKGPTSKGRGRGEEGEREGGSEREETEEGSKKKGGTGSKGAKGEKRREEE